MLIQPVRLVLRHRLQFATGGKNASMIWRNEELLWVSFVCGVDVWVAWVLRWGRRPVNGFLRLAFWLPLVPGRQGRFSCRYLCETEGVLAVEQARHPRVCLIGDGLWAR